MLQRQWSGPPLPDDPVDKLVAMGFANRELNRQLLQKHNNQLQVSERRGRRWVVE